MARRVDFLSVGSNDLTQYLLAVDRNNARVADLYHAFHPAVLQALRAVVEAGKAEGKPVTICGELAGDPLAVVLLLALGYDGLSMNATSLPKVKKVLRNLSMAEALEVLDEIMVMEDEVQIRERLERVLSERGLQKFIPSRVD
jgi:phosphotransferase system enzyme I (PtsP)